MKLTEANRVWEAPIIPRWNVQFLQEHHDPRRLYRDVLRREQPVHWVHPITLQIAFCPSLISRDDVNGDSAVSATTKLNSLKD
jgi:hypothetical protein